MLFMVVILFLLAGMLSITSNPDIFSPGKLFLIYFLSFYIGAMFLETSLLAEALVFVILLIGFWAVILEAGKVRRLSKSTPSSVRPNTIKYVSSDYSIFFWVISLPSILTQIYMINAFGGIEGYFNSIGLRVVEWSGYGWARTLIAMIVPINLIYFAIGLRNKRTSGWLIRYLAHFALMMGLTGLSGSRSSVLGVILMLFIVYHYMRAEIKIATAVVLGSALTLAAMALGVLRNTLRLSAGEFITASNSSAKFSFASFNYGIEPLQVITSSPFLPLAHGSTFMSLFTNAIPRSIWPGKPDSGGVFYTQNYLGDAWEGYSNNTPTYLGEWIINFGWEIGIIGFFFSYGLVFLIIQKYYLQILQKVSTVKPEFAAVDLVLYILIIQSAIALMVGEITNVVLSFVLSQLIPILIIKQYLKMATR